MLHQECVNQALQKRGLLLLSVHLLELTARIKQIEKAIIDLFT